MHRFLAAVLSSGLLAGLLLSCHNQSGKGVQPDSQLTVYLPASAALLGGLNLEGLRASPLYRRHQDLLNIAMVNQFSERLGVDPRRDLNEILVTWVHNKVLVLGRGRFSAAQLEPRLAAFGAHQSSYSGHPLFGDASGAVTFPKQDVIVGGPFDALHAALDGSRGGVPAAVRTQLDQIPGSDQIWVASSQSIPMDLLPSRSDVQSGLSNIAGNIRALGLGLGLDEGAHLHGDFICDSEAGAKRVHDALRGVIGMGRLMTPDNEIDMLKVYDAIQVDQDHATVRLHADLPAAEADRLLSQIPALMGHSGQLMQH